MDAISLCRRQSVFMRADVYKRQLCSFYLDEDPDIGFMFNPGGSANYGGVNSTEILSLIHI